MIEIEDIANRKFGSLTAVRFIGMEPTYGQVWLVRCECGTEKNVRKANLMSGSTQTCGCSRRKTERKQKNKKPQVKTRPVFSRMSPNVTWSVAERGWFLLDGKAYAIAQAPDDIFKKAILKALDRRLLSEDAKWIFDEPQLGITERWWLLCHLVEKKTSMTIYPSKEQALQALKSHG